MSMFKRVLLLLSVAVLFREGSSSSPLDFLKDLKNKIFASSNTTESKENPTVQCYGNDQDVCVLQNTSYNETLNKGKNIKTVETFNNFDLINGTQITDTLETEQFEGNETIIEDTPSQNTNNTQYYDEQDWNNTASNNTVKYGNDFEYPENGQEVNREASDANVGETNNQTVIREKRQIKKEEINITLKTPHISTPKPLTLRTTFLTGETATINSNTNQSSNVPRVNQVFVKGTENNTEDNKTAVTTEPSNITFVNPIDHIITDCNDTLINFSESQNATEEKDISESIPANCTNHGGMQEEASALKNTSLLLDQDVEGMEFTISDHQENSNQEYNKYITNQTNITKLADILENSNQIITNITKLTDILENSTRIIEKIVQNILPAVPMSQETKENNPIDTNNKNLQSHETVEGHNISFQGVIFNDPETDIDNNYDVQLNSTNSLVNITSEENETSVFDSLNESFKNETFNIIGHLTSSQPSGLNLNGSTAFENNIVGNVGFNSSTNMNISVNNSNNIIRDKRSINFTVLSNYDENEQDFSVSSFPEESESPAAQVSSNTTLNVTESSSWNETTQEIEVVGPVCIKQYKECTNSTECCEGYECIGTKGDNSTLYCDLQPVNLNQSTFIPITANNED